MSPALAFGLGALAGVVIATQLTSESACCARVGAAVSDKVSGKFGAPAGALFDLLGGRRWSPAVLDAFGVDP